MPNQPKTGEGNWMGSFKSGVREAAAAKSHVPTPVEEPPVVVAPSPEVIPSATREVVPTETVTTAIETPAEETPVVVPETKTSEPPQRRIVKLTDEHALVELPGFKPKSASEIAFELKRSQDLQRKENNLQYREDQLRTREDALRTAPVAQPVAPVVAPVAATAPARPEGALPGDPEYDQWIIEVSAYNSMKAYQPIIERLNAQESREREAREFELAAQRNLDTNRQLYSDAIQRLPFDINSLDEATQEQVVAQINAVAQENGVDLKAGAHVRALTPMEMNLIFQNAYPKGSLPPGYTYHQEPVETDAMRALRENDGRPLVEAPKPQPQSKIGTGAIAVPKAGPQGTAGGSWASRLTNRAQTITRG